MAVTIRTLANCIIMKVLSAQKVRSREIALAKQSFERLECDKSMDKFLKSWQKFRHYVNESKEELKLNNRRCVCVCIFLMSTDFIPVHRY